jgi:hypothetical protein
MLDPAVAVARNTHRRGVLLGGVGRLSRHDVLVGVGSGSRVQGRRADKSFTRALRYSAILGAALGKQLAVGVELGRRLRSQG